jgi:ABC-type antimicrobial peptide transport system permease subunit
MPLLRQRASEIDANLPVRIVPLNEVFLGTLAEPQLQTGLLLGFGAIAMLLASAGVFGVVSYETSRRTREIGIRVALGATRGRVIRHVMARSLRLTALGAIAGLGVASVVTRFMSSMLYGIPPTDAAAFIAGTALILLAAAFAAYLPARRASQIDPLVALRSE